MGYSRARKRLLWRHASSLFIGSLVLLGGARTVRGQNQVMGELEFEGKTKVERDSGVWIDGNYVGYLKELKNSKKITLLPGEHEVIVRQSGYIDYVQKVVVEPGQKRLISVTLRLSPHATVPEITATLKLKIKPARAAVFLDEKYVGHAGEFGGAFRYMKISPGKHRVRVELPGYRTFDTEVNLLANFPYKQTTLSVAGSAHYHDLGRFLADFENRFPHIRVSNLSLDLDAAAAEPETLSFRMDIIALVKSNPS